MQPFPVGPSTFEAIWEGRDAASAALITPKRTWSTAELRSEVDQHGSRLEAAIERGFRRQILALVTLGTTWFAITAAILQLTR